MAIKSLRNLTKKLSMKELMFLFFSSFFIFQGWGWNFDWHPHLCGLCYELTSLPSMIQSADWPPCPVPAEPQPEQLSSTESRSGPPHPHDAEWPVKQPTMVELHRWGGINGPPHFHNAEWPVKQPPMVELHKDGEVSMDHHTLTMLNSLQNN